MIASSAAAAAAAQQQATQNLATTLLQQQQQQAAAAALATTQVQHQLNLPALSMFLNAPNIQEVCSKLKLKILKLFKLKNILILIN